MEIVMTAAELIERGLWTQASDLLGIHPYAINEGRMGRDDEVTLTQEQAEKLGILPRLR